MRENRGHAEPAQPGGSSQDGCTSVHPAGQTLQRLKQATYLSVTSEELFHHQRGEHWPTERGDAVSVNQLSPQVTFLRGGNMLPPDLGEVGSSRGQDGGEQGPSSETGVAEDGKGLGQSDVTTWESGLSQRKDSQSRHFRLKQRHSTTCVSVCISYWGVAVLPALCPSPHSLPAGWTPMTYSLNC